MTDKISTPGVYDLSDAAYFADPVEGGSLTNSGAKVLTAPGCPALFKHQQDHGRPNKRAFDVGHAAHAKVLGVGEPIEVIPYDSYRTAAAKDLREAAYQAGKTPILEAEYADVLAMEQAIRAHPDAAPLFDPASGGLAEKTLIWQDAQSGVWLRSKLDWLLGLNTDRRVIAVDYKSAVSAEPVAISKAMANYGYFRQAAFYLAGIKALGLSPAVEPAFVFVFQEKDAPYLVTVVQPDPEALMWGELDNRRAIDLYARCKATDNWPGYVEGIASVGLPAWELRQHENALMAGQYETNGARA